MAANLMCAIWRDVGGTEVKVVESGSVETSVAKSWTYITSAVATKLLKNSGYQSRSCQQGSRSRPKL